MCKLHIIGTTGQGIGEAEENLLQNCGLVVATKRLQKMVSHLAVRCHDISPLDTAIQAIGVAITAGDVAVLASGDPLFYGIGRRLLAEFPEQVITFYPAVSAIQQASARFRMPWDDAAIISLHGRTCHHLPGLLLCHAKSLIFTDGKYSPDCIARELLQYLQLIDDTEKIENIRLSVAENIGLSDERIIHGNLLQFSKQRFAPLNVLCIRHFKKKSGFNHILGLSEDEICHSRGLITKSEVRAASLHQLRLPTTGVFWDVGAGSGSLSIEAARLNPNLTVYAIEHKEEEIHNIKKNIVKFGCYNIVPIFGRAPEVFSDLPRPNRIFVGGSSGALPDIVGWAGQNLSPGERLVINGVIAATIQSAPLLMHKHGFTVSTSAVHVTRMNSEGHAQEFNPISIMTGAR